MELKELVIAYIFDNELLVYLQAASKSLGFCTKNALSLQSFCVFSIGMRKSLL